jgi:hypothetical protein
VKSIDEALRDRALLGAALGDPVTWATWFAVLRAAFGLPLDAGRQELFAGISGGRAPPTRRMRELWVVAGRRGGKSRIAAALAVYFACFVKHRLARGERGMVLVLAASMEQARVVFEAALAFLTDSPVLCQEVAETTRTEIRLRNGIVIAIHSNSFRSIRGRTLVACVLDEVAFWRDETSVAPDTETYTALLPSLATTNGMLVGISSAYRRTGLIYNKFKQYFGVDSDDTLVVQGGSKIFNPSLDDEAIAAQRAADPIAAKSEWDSEWRDDLSGFLDENVIEGSINPDRPLELPPISTLYYRAFVDASGGSAGGDAYAICIAHREAGIYVIDVVRARTGPFDPENVTKEFAALCRDYRIGSVTGDRYAAEWVTSMWRKQAINYQASELTASELYLEALPLFTRALVSLPEHRPLIRELMLLERSTGRMGRDMVSHPTRGHDDMANCVCGVLYGLNKYLGNQQFWDIMGGTGSREPERPPRRHPATMTEAEYQRWAQPPLMLCREVLEACPEWKGGRR